MRTVKLVKTARRQRSMQREEQQLLKGINFIAILLYNKPEHQSILGEKWTPSLLSIDINKKPTNGT